jgi:quercetin dioxygenase-like cupin family protein
MQKPPASPHGGPCAFAVTASEVPEEGHDEPESGNLTWRTLISSNRTPSAEMTVGVATFPPQGTLKRHRHEPAEFYFGLAGSGAVTVEGERFAIGPGIAVYIPGNNEHGIEAGSNGLTLLYGFARDDFESIAYQFTHEGTG